MTDPTGHTGTLVDSNVLLDLLTEDPTWTTWSEDQLAAALDSGPVLINQVIYAEVSVRFTSVEDVNATLSPERFIRANLPWSAAFLAARAHSSYRLRGGHRIATLPDFFVGAHAAVLGLRLLTRDAARYRTYFPTVTLIAP